MAGATRGARAELLRLRKWPAVWLTLGAWLLLNLMFGYLFNYLSYTGGTTAFADEGATKASLLAQMLPGNAPNVFIQGMPMFDGALMMVLGAIVAGNGYGWGTWRTVFAQGTRRTAVTVGSLVALTVFVIATPGVAFGFDLGVSVDVATTESQRIVMPSLGPVVEAVGTGFLVLEMWSLLGYALGTLARGPALHRSRSPGSPHPCGVRGRGRGDDRGRRSAPGRDVTQGRAQTRRPPRHRCHFKADRLATMSSRFSSTLPTG